MEFIAIREKYGPRAHSQCSAAPPASGMSLARALPGKTLRRNSCVMAAAAARHSRQYQLLRTGADDYRPQICQRMPTSAPLASPPSKKRWKTGIDPAGARDTVMDLSTGRYIHETRESGSRATAFGTTGTVPIYRQRWRRQQRTPEILPGKRSTTRRWSRPNRASTTSPFTGRAAAPCVPMTAKRLTGIVSRGGSLIMAKWCLSHHKEQLPVRTFPRDL